MGYSTMTLYATEEVWKLTPDFPKKDFQAFPICSLLVKLSLGPNMEPLQVIQLRGTEPLDLGPNEGKALYGLSTKKTNTHVYCKEGQSQKVDGYQRRKM